MAFYRKAPMVVQAVQIRKLDDPDYSGSPEFSEMPDWLSKAIVSKVVYPSGCRGWKVNTLENGIMLASPGDWLVFESEYEIYPVTPTKFIYSYEAIDRENKLKC